MDAFGEKLLEIKTREDFLPAACELVSKEPGPWCCVAIDIQHFKIFTSWFGYDKSQALIHKICENLLKIEQTEAAVASHFGRDNFALLIRHDEDEIKRIYEEIHQAIQSFSNMVGFLPAIGICLMEEGESPTPDLYEKAVLAVEEAKKSYLDRIRYFDPVSYNQTKANYRILTDFQLALKNHEISFHLQPQCQIYTGKIIGVEALARWIKKDGTIVGPASFIPFLESSGFITELDKCVWTEVCRWIRSLMDRGIRPVPVSVNVSKVDLQQMDVADYLFSLTQTFDISPSLLKIEITESTYASDFDAISETITKLKTKGFTVFLDDFGAGYSSLNMLDKINADVLKLDMIFMRKENSLSRKGISIVESILGMSKVLDMPVIVEGVETEDQVSFLNNLGCRYAQGYYFYRPMSIAACEKILMDKIRIDYDGISSRPTDLFHARDFLNENMFTDSMINHVLGAVAYYTLEGRDLTISRFNESFYKAIGDPKMNSRKAAIQNYVVQEDWPQLYHALETAESNAADGGSCEIRFYKSDNSVFWFHMKFFFLKEDRGKKLFFGQVEDITESREQSIRFFEVLRKQSYVTMRMDLDRNIIQYVTGENTLFHVNLPYMNLDESIRMTAQNRIPSDLERTAFMSFFNSERLKEQYLKAIYHEVLNINFRLYDTVEPVEFSTYYIRYSKDQSLTVYAFAKRSEHELLEKDPLTGLKNRYAYNNTLHVFEQHGTTLKDLIVFSMDINGLKKVNDTYGHDAGDDLIRAAADCIGSVMAPHGDCFRIAGDEFVALLYGDRKLAEQLKPELESALSGYHGHLVSPLSISSGYAIAADYPDANIADLIKIADSEMYQAKSNYHYQMGIGKDIQQDAFLAIYQSFTKILRVNLQNNSFEIIRANMTELNSEKGYHEHYSVWIRNFAAANQIHPEDAEYVLRETDPQHLRLLFDSGQSQMTTQYRRKIGSTFRNVLLEAIPTQDYTPETPTIFIYLKEIG